MKPHLTHASRELVAAVAGDQPHSTDCEGYRFGAYSACGSSRDMAATEWAIEGLSVVGTVIAPRNTRTTNCPSCLLLLRSAMDPVRWDYLEVRGLVPKLEAA